MNRAFFQSLLDNCRRDRNTGCLYWQHKARGGGTRYRLRVNGKNCSIHRLLFGCYIKRPLGKDECLMQLCDSPGCIEPRHFRLVARRDLNRWNARRSVRLPRKLSAVQVREIRRTPRHAAWHTAKQYGVSRALVRMIIGGKRRRSVSASPEY